MLRKHFAVILILMLSASCYAQDVFENQKSCFRGNFESYETWKSFLSVRKRNFNEEEFIKEFPEEKFNTMKNSLQCIDFTYQVDDLTVEGYLLKPKVNASKPLPLVVYNRGGNAEFGYMNFGRKAGLIAEIALAGYAVIGSQYRGSSKKYIANNGNDEFGGKDVEDVISLIELAKSLPGIDTKNISLVGWSRGVMQSYLVAKQVHDISTIISISGVSDLEKGLKKSPRMKRVYRRLIPEFTTQPQEELSKRSVINWVDKLPKGSPILLIHGSEDKRVDIEQSKMLSLKLNNSGHLNKLVILNGGDHSLSNNRELLATNILDWLNMYSKT